MIVEIAEYCRAKRLKYISNRNTKAYFIDMYI